MPYLVAFITWFTTFVTDFVVKYFGQKALTFLVTVSSLATVFAFFILSLKGLIVQVNNSFVPVQDSNLLYGIGIFMPSNFELDLSLCIAAIASRFSYDFAISKILVGNAAK